MGAELDSRSDRKQKALLAATELFLNKGYDGATMDEVAAIAEVSKPTIYRYFSDKEHLFAAIVRATLSEFHTFDDLASDFAAQPASAELGLVMLANRMMSTMMRPRMLRLHRLIIANAERFPEICRLWYEQGLQHVAANQFLGMLLWIPTNKAMFKGNNNFGPEELEAHVVATVGAFLTSYRHHGKRPFGH